LKRRKRGRAPPPHLSSQPAPDEFYNDPLSFRQIDAKARRKLEHPSHSSVLRSDRLVHNALRSLEGESLRKAAAKTTSPASAESAEAAWPRAN
jgi:hypothetical protein